MTSGNNEHGQTPGELQDGQSALEKSQRGFVLDKTAVRVPPRCLIWHRSARDASYHVIQYAMWSSCGMTAGTPGSSIRWNCPKIDR